MSNTKAPFVLPPQIETLVGSASRLLDSQGRKQLVALLANARVEVTEEESFDNYDGGQSGHGVRLHVPEALYHQEVDRIEDYGDELRDLLNKMTKHISGEHIASVAFCLDLGTVPATWREDSGALLAPPTLVQASKADIRRLWGDGEPRVFLSHRTTVKAQTKKLKDELAKYGAASFVAHDDVEPTREWQDEIERALATMDVLVALLTDGFGASYWTNQEVGVALGRGIRVVSVRVDEDPKGFISSQQALPGNGRSPEQWAKDLMDVFSADQRFAGHLQVGLVVLWERAANYQEGIRVMKLLEAQHAMPQELLQRVEHAYTANNQLHGSAVVKSRYAAFIARMKSGGKG